MPLHHLRDIDHLLHSAHVLHVGHHHVVDVRIEKWHESLHARHFFTACKAHASIIGAISNITQRIHHLGCLRNGTFEPIQSIRLSRT